MSEHCLYLRLRRYYKCSKFFCETPDLKSICKVIVMLKVTGIVHTT